MIYLLCRHCDDHGSYEVISYHANHNRLHDEAVSRNEAIYSDVLRKWIDSGGNGIIYRPKLEDVYFVKEVAESVD